MSAPIIQCTGDALVRILEIEIEKRLPNIIIDLYTKETKIVSKSCHLLRTCLVDSSLAHLGSGKTLN